MNNRQYMLEMVTKQVAAKREHYDAMVTPAMQKQAALDVLKDKKLRAKYERLIALRAAIEKLEAEVGTINEAFHAATLPPTVRFSAWEGITGKAVDRRARELAGVVVQMDCLDAFLERAEHRIRFIQNPDMGDVLTAMLAELAAL